MVVLRGAQQRLFFFFFLFISVFRTFSFKFPTIVGYVGFFLISLHLISFERKPGKSCSFTFKKHVKFNIIDKLQLVKIELNPFLKEKSKFRKTWLSILGCHCNVNVDLHLTATLKCF